MSGILISSHLFSECIADQQGNIRHFISAENKTKTYFFGKVIIHFLFYASYSSILSGILQYSDN